MARPPVVALFVENFTFRRFLASRAISLVGDAIIPTAIAVALSARGEPAVWLGAALAAALIPKVILLVVGGELAVRFAKVRLIVVTSLICGVAQILTAVLILAGADIGWVVALQAVYGAMTALNFPATFAYLPVCVGPQDLPLANGVLATITATASIVGPLITAGIVGIFGHAELGLLLDGASFFLAALLVVSLPSPRSTEAIGGRIRLLDGFRELVKLPWLLRITVADGLILMGVAAPFVVLGPVLFRDRANAEWPLVLLAFAAGELVGSVVGTRIRSRSALRIVAVSLLFLAPPPLLLALDSPLPVLCAAEVLAGVGVGAYGVIVTSAIQRSTEPAVLGRVGAVCSMTSFAMLPTGYVLAPLLAALVGAVPLLVAAGAVAVVIGLLVVMDPYVRTHDARPTASLSSPDQVQV